MNAVEYFKKHGWNDTKVALESPFGLGEFEHLWDDLKRLVDSWELVEYEGGLIKAKNVLFLKRALGLTPHADRLEKAIADVEKCQ